jgi:hypothetical protein
MGRFRNCNLTYHDALSTDSCLQMACVINSTAFCETYGNLIDYCNENRIKQGIGCALKKNYTQNLRGKGRSMFSMVEHLSRTVPSANV